MNNRRIGYRQLRALEIAYTDGRVDARTLGFELGTNENYGVHRGTIRSLQFRKLLDGGGAITQAGIEAMNNAHLAEAGR
jgi:hypothetical protein